VNDLKAFWVAFFRPGSNISIRPCGLAIHRSPTFSDRSSSSLELSVLFSVLFQPPAFRTCRAPHLSMVHPVCQKAPPLGFSPSSRLQSAQLGRGLPLPRPGFSQVSLGQPALSDAPPLAFCTPSTVSSATDLASLFHPAAAFRVFLFRGFSLTRSRSSFRWPLPSCRSSIEPAV
jgi:hypothetical protein